MIIGIDLGTTNSAVAYINKDGLPEIIHNKEGSRVTPSVIMFEEDSVIVGEIAKENANLSPFNIVQFVKRQIGNKNFKFINDSDVKYTAEELSAIILKKLKEDAEEFLGEKIDKAVITVPAYFDDAQRRATKDAGRIVGLEVSKIINEPTAAALSYGFSNIKDEESSNILVYDLGGGTFDATIMKIDPDKIKTLATGGDKNMGGFDFDNQIIESVIEVFEEEHNIDIYDDLEAFQELRQKSENAKIQLSSRNSTMFSVASEGKKVKYKITRKEFEDKIKVLINRTVVIMNQVLSDAELSWNDIDKILLVGGSTRIPLIEEMISKETGIRPSRNINPDEAVAMGAAIQGMLINDFSETDQYEEKIKIIDVCSHSIGIVISDENGNKKNNIILKRNTSIPATENQIFAIVSDNQEYIQLEVTEGEDSDLGYVNIIGKAFIKLPQGLAKNTQIKIEISFDENQIVHAFAYLNESNQYLGELHIECESNLTEEEIEEKSTLINKIIID